MMKQVCRNLGEKSCDENVSRLPSNYFRNGREDRLMKMMLVKSKRESLKELQRSKQNSSFQSKDKTEEFSIIRLF
jgi:hypothetical protein